ncbi:MAG: hypothetical protein V4510_12085 [bacterium]
MDSLRDLWQLVRKLRLQEHLTDLDTKVARLGDLLGAVAAKEQRSAQTLTSIPVGTTDVTVTWPASWPDPGYGVYPTLITGAAATGLMGVTLKTGTKTPEDCVVTVANRTGGTVASAGLDVLGVRT